MDLCETSLSRRALLGTSGALFAWAFMPRIARAAGGRDARFVCIVLRGALDGLAAVAPVGDPAYAGLHGDLALSLDGEIPALPLDGFFALHPSMPNFARLYKAGQASVVHAAATGYRERSHFDGQDVLESGQPAPGKIETGWLNRFLAGLPAGDRIAPAGALGVGPVAPLVVRGPAPVLGWSPAVLPPAGDDLADRLAALYAERDPALHRMLIEGLKTEDLIAMNGPAIRRQGGLSDPKGMSRTALGAARLLAQEDGPRIAGLAFEGWDTHANEGGVKGQLANRLRGLDDAIGVFAETLGPTWKDTALMVVTEFGRTARINGTRGTDHGTGTVVLLAGGAIRGGRVIADWPGLSDAALLDGRDLRPTTDVRSVAKGILADLFGAPAGYLARDVFPDTAGLAPLKDLVA
ncbi:DUF1501 domain-containing protein [Ancylobacter defluvii]|uniref:DUF1501 domain-containing protein n=1 Tax=Ancylobacter defluvii TaxID=1282440 RepID=A0A9W6JXM6_9HYPH|nr:DUF1501 domain-containing protein [Ancylobacter defluvii]MBS7585821.1 DUF1501 domain-containing protein [Ancylobacter defluvii]GLK84194.1 hypothetical protein GCM10017653_22640 [Ancylobacter defluvii]